MFEPLRGEKMQRDYAWAFFRANGFDLPAKARLSPREYAIEYAIRKRIKPADFLGPTRTRHICQPRQDCMADIKKDFPKMSYRSIGRIFGGRDHSTVMHSIRRSKERAEAGAQT